MQEVGHYLFFSQCPLWTYQLAFFGCVPQIHYISASLTPASLLVLPLLQVSVHPLRHLDISYHSSQSQVTFCQARAGDGLHLLGPSSI